VRSLSFVSCVFAAAAATAPAWSAEAPAADAACAALAESFTRARLEPAQRDLLKRYKLEALDALAEDAYGNGLVVVELLKSAEYGQASDLAVRQLRLLSSLRAAGPEDYPQALDEGARIVHEGVASLPGGLEQNAIPPQLERRRAAEIVAQILRAFFTAVPNLRQAYARSLAAAATHAPEASRAAAIERLAGECKSAPAPEKAVLRATFLTLPAQPGDDAAILSALLAACPEPQS
jgi:hypothetical protein